MKIAFATCPAWPDGFADDHEAAALAGAEFRLWDDPSVDWQSYDRVVLRSVWDYTRRLDDFLDWCDRVGAERLRNTPELVAFNADKRYLGKLGVPIVPTAFVGPDGPPPDFDGEVVVKPNVSAGARDTGRFPAERHDEALGLVEAIRSSGRVALVQPYLPGVDERGETAIVYLDGEVSHVLRKRPVLRAAGLAPLGDDPDGPAAVMLDEDLVLPGEATEAELLPRRRSPRAGHRALRHPALRPRRHRPRPRWRAGADRARGARPVPLPRPGPRRGGALRRRDHAVAIRSLPACR